MSAEGSSGEKTDSSTPVVKDCDGKQEGKASNQKSEILPSEITLHQEASFNSEMGDAVEPLEPESVDTEEPIIKPDSTNSSISKYNYLFYFIYKYKFESKFRLDQI